MHLRSKMDLEIDEKIKETEKRVPGKKGPANCETHAKVQNFHIIRGDSWNTQVRIGTSY